MTAAEEPAGGAVRVLPSGIEFDVAAGEPVLRAARRAGYVWPTVCGGDAVCQVCALTIREGAEHAGPIGSSEGAALGTRVLSNGFPIRLACQLRVAGPMTVHKVGVRPAPTPEQAPTSTPIGTTKGT